MYTFISPKGEKIKAKSLKAFASEYQFNTSSACLLSKGLRASINGWCSNHPRVRKKRQKFLTTLINVKTGEKDILGQSITGFAERHGLASHDVYQLIHKHIRCYRGWMLEKTYNKIYNCIPDENI
jgi:hypothetical protein